MDNIIKYIMGVAAKSNVEKRQVGCVITLDGVIVAEGFNTSMLSQGGGEEAYIEHAEVAACRNMCEESLDIDSGLGYKAYVTHPPCPDCAKQLAEYGITDIEVVEAFMKFDGDKLRYDLIPVKAWQKLATHIDTVLKAGPISEGYNTIVTYLHDYQLNGSSKDLCSSMLGWVVMNRDGEGGSYSLITPNFLEGLAEVLTFGARKYKPNNWRKVDDPGRYLAATYRHLEAIRCGEELDEESGLHHWKHFCTNIMFLIELDYVPNEQI